MNTNTPTTQSDPTNGVKPGFGDVESGRLYVGKAKDDSSMNAPNTSTNPNMTPSTTPSNTASSTLGPPPSSAANSVPSSTASSANAAAAKPADAAKDSSKDYSAKDQAATSDTAADKTPEPEMKFTAEWLRWKAIESLDTFATVFPGARDLVEQIKKNPLPYALAGAGTLVALVTGISIAASLRKPTFTDRLHAAGKAWQNPQKAFRSFTHSPMVAKDIELVRGAVVTALSYLGTEAVKHGMAAFADKLQATKQSFKS